MGVKRRRGMCRYKTSKGNVYSNYTDAKNAAVGMGSRLKAPGKGLNAYYCEFCGKWHIGRLRDRLRRFQYYLEPQKYSIIQYLENWMNENLEKLNNTIEVKVI